MALINCTECGKEVSDKATTCPHCGNPLQASESNQEYIVCPKCNSKDLHAEHKGFSGGKALTGALLTGGIGLLAGTIGRKDVQLTCLKCGNKFKTGEGKVISSNRTSEIIYDEDRIVELLREGKTFEATNLMYSENPHVLASDVANEVRKIGNKYQIDIQPYKPSFGCFGLILAIISTSSLLLIFFS